MYVQQLFFAVVWSQIIIDEKQLFSERTFNNSRLQSHTGIIILLSNRTKFEVQVNS